MSSVLHFTIVITLISNVLHFTIAITVISTISQVIKATGTNKCDYYRDTQGYECVPYYQARPLP